MSEKVTKLKNPQPMDTMPTSGKVYFGESDTLDVISREYTQYIYSWIKNMTGSKREKKDRILKANKNSTMMWSYGVEEA